VVPVLADPVGLGFAASDARPNGNLTGIAPYIEGLPAKQLELAREMVPGAKRIGLLDDVIDPKAHPQRREIEAAAEVLEVKIITAEVRTPADIGPAYDALSSERVEVLIADAAAMKKLPSVYGYREHVDAGGLVSYGVNLNWCYHRSAYYVDKILKGAKPRELPIEFPTKIEFVINLKTAKALGLDVPTSILLRADAVIE
jgi:putative ABC transport system substrate-binding protein